MEAVTIDTQKTEEIAGKMLQVLNNGAVAVMASIGHRIGLFDAMSALPPSTSAEIAAAAGLDERYVREWLGAMVVSEIVECDPSGVNAPTGTKT